jgi:hypothetical protein
MIDDAVAACKLQQGILYRTNQFRQCLSSTYKFAVRVETSSETP